MKYQAILFDLDGTLIDTVPDLADAANAMRTELNMPAISNDTIGTYIGRGIESLINRTLGHGGVAVDEAMFNHGIELFRKYYGQFNGAKARLYPDVIAGLESFKELGARLAIVTNKSIEFVPGLLAHMGISQYFDVMVGGDTCTEKKPDPMPLLHACNLFDIGPKEALFIGDSINDSIAAKACNMDMLVVPYGYNEGEPVQNLPANAIVDTVLDAAQWARTNS